MNYYANCQYYILHRRGRLWTRFSPLQTTICTPTSIYILNKIKYEHTKLILKNKRSGRYDNNSVFFQYRLSGLILSSYSHRWMGIPTRYKIKQTKRKKTMKTGFDVCTHGWTIKAQCTHFRSKRVQCYQMNDAVFVQYIISNSHTTTWWQQGNASEVTWRRLYVAAGFNTRH